jgi:hypothetical protein
MATRGTSNTNERGSAANRAARKRWLLREFGDGQTATCSTCPAVLDLTSITVDRYPLPGCEGGRYIHGNIRPQCSPCASKQGGHLGATRKASKGGRR